ncbi:MAG: nucleotidyltransferase domain-containing protein [Candidatus Woesearchaeota archaeon]|nr:nucleotidyltransferase domain-containing protein [Candidatus Woesearchaeota archaeon]
MLPLIFTQDCYKLLIVFAASPGSRWQRKELQKFTRLNNTQIDRALRLLLSAAMLTKKKRLYALNHEQAIQEHLINEYKRLRQLPFSVYFTIVDIVFFLARHNVTVYLFGSYAKLTYKDTSDIDIAILWEEKIDKKSVANTQEKINRKYGEKLELHYFEKKSFMKNKGDPLVKDILKNGLQL